jgi:hypothetical protein
MFTAEIYGLLAPVGILHQVSIKTAQTGTLQRDADNNLVPSLVDHPVDILLDKILRRTPEPTPENPIKEVVYDCYILRAATLTLEDLLELTKETLILHPGSVTGTFKITELVYGGMPETQGIRGEFTVRNA